MTNGALRCQARTSINSIFAETPWTKGTLLVMPAQLKYGYPDQISMTYQSKIS